MRGELCPDGESMPTATPGKLTVNSIERRHKLPYDEFVSDFVMRQRPVVITGALDAWKAKNWTPELFRDRFPGKEFQIGGQKYRMAEFIDLVLNSSEDKPAPYLRNAVIERFLPELLGDIMPEPEYFLPNWTAGPLTGALQSRLDGGRPQLYIGGKGGKFPFLHFDGWRTYAFLCQIYGTKEYTTYTEDQAQYLYPKPGHANASLVSDIENPDFEKFPLFAKATPVRFQLGPGELLFIPDGLWHTAKILSPSITVSVNRANAWNWKRLSRDICSKAPIYARPAAMAYFTGLRLVRTLRGA